MANAFNQFDSGFDSGNAMADQFAKQRAGNAMAGGDYGGAANALYRSGQLDAGSSVQNFGQAQHRQEVADKAAFFLKAAGALSQIPDDGTQTARKAALNHLVPTFKAMGIDDSTIGQLQQADLSNASLSAFGAQLQKELEIIHTDQGIFSVNKATGDLKTLKEFPQKPVGFKSDEFIYAPGEDTSGGTAAAGAEAPASPPTADAVWQNIIKQESGAKPGVIGPKTPYGQAQGETQMLPATAKAMAQKLGVAWRPDLMTARTPEAEAYQLKLGRAYFDEGVAANGGDVAKGAAYYYGGPNPALHGPKTQAYVQAVAGGAQPQAQAAQTGDAAPRIPGYHLVHAPGPDGSPELTPASLDMAATEYAMTGKMPAYGMKGRDDKIKIQNRGAELIKEWGITPADRVTGMARVKVAQGTLRKVSDQEALIGSFERTANDNAQLALSLAPKGAGPTGAPILDQYIRAGFKATGNADVAKFDAALGGFTDEYAKIISGSMGNTPASDSVRADAHRRLNSAMSRRQLSGVIATMQTEMANRMKEIHAENLHQMSLLGTIGPGPMGGDNSTWQGNQGAAPAPAQPASVATAGQPRIRVYNPKTGALE